MAMEAWQYYLKKSQEVVKRFGAQRVLKMDVDNEIHSYPIQGGIAGNLQDCSVAMVEYSHEKLNRAQGILGNVGRFSFYCADIRALPFENDSFDLILDLSTLDHIPPTDVDEVLGDYSHIAPHLLLVTWLAGDKPSAPQAVWSPNDQYFFAPSLVEEAIAKYYDVLEADKSFYHVGSNFLAYYLCQRKDFTWLSHATN